MYLETIQSPKDVKALTKEELDVLSQEIRHSLLAKLSACGGHIGPNLGMVEATIALHYVFSSPEDKIVYDVSHQSYVHKMLTGRVAAFINPDEYRSVSGYTNTIESEHDFFNVGHTSTSVSLALGLAKGRDLCGGSENVIAVIGDGSLSGGEAFEGLSNAGEMKTNFIVVVNDNDMSIAENHGGLYKNLKLLRETDGKAECNYFRSLGLEYIFVKDGNDTQSLIEAFEKVRDSKTPVVVHIVTQKGKGYAPAEANKEQYHYGTPFSLETGKPNFESDVLDYSTLTGEYLLKKMAADEKVVAITAGTPTVAGFTQENREKAGKQFVDVGIAEEHAVALASGIAKRGGKPVWGVYSTFVQRVYDQISQDLCLNNNAAVIPVFAATVKGMNDMTHLGFFDIAILSNIPNLVYLAPTCKEEYLAMLDWAIEQDKHPVAIRVPGFVAEESGQAVETDYSELNKYKMVAQGSEVAVIALGSFFSLGKSVAERIEAELGIKPTLINPRYITGVDSDMLEELKKNHSVVITLEDGILDGGFGEKIARFYGSSPVRTLNYGLKKEFADRFDASQLMEECRLTDALITEDVAALIK